MLQTLNVAIVPIDTMYRGFSEVRIWVHDCILEFKMELYWLHCSDVARIAGFIS